LRSSRVKGKALAKHGSTRLRLDWDGEIEMRSRSRPKSRSGVDGGVVD